MPADTAYHSSLQSSTLPASHSPLHKTPQPVAAFACSITSLALATSGSPSEAEACMLKSASVSRPNPKAPQPPKPGARTNRKDHTSNASRFAIPSAILSLSLGNTALVSSTAFLCRSKENDGVSMGNATLISISRQNPKLSRYQVGDRQTSCFNKNS